LPPRGKIYSINEGNYKYFDEPSKKYVDQVKQKYSARYVGSMVSDIHRTLLYGKLHTTKKKHAKAQAQTMTDFIIKGGIFGYPADSKSKKGKLRILYEVFPMAFLIEQAGGKATTGTMDCLDLVPEHIHDRSGIWLGSKDDVEDLEAFYKA
jgi:fructose-1,6-bisphosphatase I